MSFSPQDICRANKENIIIEILRGHEDKLSDGYAYYAGGRDKAASELRDIAIEILEKISFPFDKEAA